MVRDCAIPVSKPKEGAIFGKLIHWSLLLSISKTINLSNTRRKSWTRSIISGTQLTGISCMKTMSSSRSFPLTGKWFSVVFVSAQLKKEFGTTTIEVSTVLSLIWIYWLRTLSTSMDEIIKLPKMVFWSERNSWRRLMLVIRWLRSLVGKSKSKKKKNKSRK